MPGVRRSVHLVTLVRALHGRDEIPYRELVFEIGQTVPPGVAVRRAISRREFERRRFEARKRISDRRMPEDRKNQPGDNIEVGRAAKGREAVSSLMAGGYLVRDETTGVKILRTTDHFREVVAEHSEWYDHPDDPFPDGYDEPEGAALTGAASTG